MRNPRTIKVRGPNGFGARSEAASERASLEGRGNRKIVMKRAPSKKGPERRKRPRSAQKRAKAPVSAKLKTAAAEAVRQATETLPGPGAESAGAAVAVEASEFCQNCGRGLMNEDRALFVEEEVGRIFCSENCISTFFTPEIERLEKEYHRRVSQGDLTKEERESYSHLRWITLQEPDEIWREKTLNGDHRYTLISEFMPGNKRVWCVCICLFLKGEPSFLYLAFTSKNTALINAYRRGERMEWAPTKGQAGAEQEKGAEGAPEDMRSDRLADEWTDDETFLAQVTQERREDDISPDEFQGYQQCLEPTLETPDEVWGWTMGGASSVKLYHFIRYYGPSPDEEEGLGYWYVIVARETDDEEQIEILDAFPTRDASLVDRYRRGEQEVGNTSPGPTIRIVH